MDRGINRSIVWLTVVASAAMLCWMARPLALGEVPLTGDLLHFHYPLRDFYSSALAKGHHFEWMPSLLGGFDVAAEGQLGAYHPLHWLLYRFLPLDSAFDIELVMAYPALFVGTWLFLRRWCITAAALFGAMLFTFCGFALSHGVHVNMVAVVAHLPWLLWSLHGAYLADEWRVRFRFIAAVGLLTGSQILLGHPQAVWFSVLVEAGYALFLLAAVPARSRGWGTGALLAGKLLGVALGAIQLLATWQAAQNSTRASFDASFATTFALPPIQLLQLLHPYLFWGRVLRWTELPNAGDEFAAYGGAVPLVLIAWWLARYPGMRARTETTPSDRVALWALGLGGLGLWLAIGGQGGLYYLQTWLPVVGQFRAPVRYVLFTQFAFAVVASVALMRLISPQRRDASTLRSGLWAPWIVVALSGGSAIWLVSTLYRGVDMTSAVVLAAVLGPVLLGGAALLLTLATRGARWAVLALVLFAAGDQALYGLAGVTTWRDFLTREEAVRLIGPRDSLPPTETGRIACCPFPDLYELAGYRLIEGYVGLTPTRRLNYHSPRTLRLAEVTYAHARFMGDGRLPGAEQISRDWYRLPAPLPRARLVTEHRVSDQPAVDIEQIEIERAALVTHSLELTPGTAGSAVIVVDEPGVIRLRTDAGGQQLLVVSEAFDDGWVATIDGQPAVAERVNGDFLGAVIPAGHHDVVLEFLPTYRATGGLISLCALGLAVVTAAAGSVRLSRPSRPLRP